MHGSTPSRLRHQRGVSLSGLIVVLAALGMLAVLAMKVFPSFIEYRAIKEGITLAKATNGGVQEMQAAFTRNAEVNNVSSINAKDLIISKDSGETEISFAYEKRIPLIGPTTLLIEYEGTTAANGVVAKPKAE